MAGTPPARASPVYGVYSPAVLLPRLALEAGIAQPTLIFEPSLRLSFANAAARRWLGLDKVTAGPDVLGYSFQDLFGTQVDLAQLAQTAFGEAGDFGEQVRTLEIRRRHTADAVLVRAVVTAFVPAPEGTSSMVAGGYFAIKSATSSQAGSKPPTPSPLSPREELGPTMGGTSEWYTIVLQSVIGTSPASSSTSTQRGSATLGTTPLAGGGAGALSPYAQFAASALSRTKVPVLRPPSSSGSPSAISRGVAFSLAGPASAGSGSGSVRSGGSSAPLTSAGSRSTGSSSIAPMPPTPPSDPFDASAAKALSPPDLGPKTPVRPPPPPSKTSPAAAVIAQIRAADAAKRAGVLEDDETAVVEAPTSSEPMPTPPEVALEPELASRPTSPGVPAEPPPHPSSFIPAPAPTPSADPTSPLQNPLLALTHAALSHLPKTGLILASSDLSGGYVNDMARELLLGQRSTQSADPSEWLEDGLWIAQPGPGGKWTWDGAEFFRGLATNSLSDDSAAGSSGRGGDTETASSTGQTSSAQRPSSDRYTAYSDQVPPEEPGYIGAPTQLYKMTVSTILQRSARFSRARKRAAQEATATEDNVSEMTASAAPPLPRRPSAFRTRTVSDTISSQSTAPPPSRKPYKVYDATFSQRVIDPLEPLLEMCARRGEDPANSVGSDGGSIIVGIEVDMSEAAALREDSLATFPSVVPARRVRRRVVEVRGAPMRRPDGTHLGGMLILRDVTDERDPSGQSSTVAIRERTTKRGVGEASGSYYKQILDQMPQMVWTTTPQGSHDYFNTPWYDYTGLEPEQSLGLGWQNPFHDEDMPHTIKAWSHSLTTGEPYSVEYRCRRHDGAWRWMLGRALPMRDVDGTISGWFGTCTDVEDFITTREQLAKTQAQLSSVLSGADALIVAVDVDLRITLAQGAHLGEMIERGSIMADSTGSVTGLRFGKVFPRTAELVRHMGTIVRGELDHHESEFSEQVDPNAAENAPTPTYRIALSPLFETHQGARRIAGCVMVATDVTSIRSVESALQRSVDEGTRLLASEAAAKEASRLKSEFVANISHETRTPAAGVLGMAELLLDDPTLSGSQREGIEKIHRAGQILLDMLSHVLDMGKAEAGKLEVEHQRFYLADVLADMAIFGGSAEKKGLDYRIEMVDGPAYAGPVIGDAMRLRQIFSNLLSNALKFTSVGSVVFSYSQPEETAELVWVRVVVRDTGVGIKAEAIAKLFQPFHQADASTARRFGGTGLGLAIAKNLVELMGGSIDLESVYDVGTTLTVNVPFAKAATTPTSTPDPELSRRASLRKPPSPVSAGALPVDRSSVRLLVAEDNDLNREIAVKMLSKLGFRNVDAVADGHEALAAVAAARERPYDLIILDCQMPSKDGYEATRDLRRDPDPRVRAVPIVALTASAIAGDREKCIDAGMSDYLAKPVRTRELEEMLLKHLASALPSSSPGSTSAPPP